MAWEKEVAIVRFIEPCDYQAHSCFSCKSTKCSKLDILRSYCPKWVCDNDKGYKCNECAFIKEYYKLGDGEEI